MSPIGRHMMIPFLMLIVAAVPTGAVPADAVPSTPQPAGSLTATSSSVSSGPVRWSVEIDKHEAQVAEPIQLTLSLEAPSGTRVRMPVISDVLGDFEVRSIQTRNDVPLGEQTGRRRWFRRVTLETVRTGGLAIPSLIVLFHRADGTEFEELQSDSLSLRVRSVLEDRADPTKFRDIKDVVDMALPVRRSWAWLGWTGGTIAVAALAGLTFIALRRRRTASPAAWAREQIAELESRQVLDSAGPEAFYGELADILREFVQLRFGVSAMTQATDDVLANAARQSDLSPRPQTQLAAFLAVADDVKFAQRELTRADARDAIGRAKQFIDECARETGSSVTEVD